MSNRALAQTVTLFDPLEIIWEVSVDGQNWCPAGISQNQAYVTLNDPITTAKPGIAPPIVKFGNHPVYHSLLHLGCRAAQGVGGLSAEQETLEAIWTNGFSVNKATPITRVDGTPLTYYKTTTHGALYTAELLQTGEGTCNAWATLFLDTLRIQGLTYDRALSQFTPKHSVEAARGGFLIKNWIFLPQADMSEEAPYPYLNLAADPVETFAADGVAYHWFPPNEEEVQDDRTGMSGQDTVNPVAMFNTHWSVFIDGYYDPSYGQQYSDFQTLANTAMVGFYKKADLNNQTSVNEVHVGTDGEDLNGNSQVENLSVLLPNQYRSNIPYLIRQPLDPEQDIQELAFEY